MTFEHFGVLLEDLVDGIRRIAVALEELVALGHVYVEATVMAEDDETNGGEVEIMRCP